MTSDFLPRVPNHCTKKRGTRACRAVDSVTKLASLRSPAICAKATRREIRAIFCWEPDIILVTGVGHKRSQSWNWVKSDVGVKPPEVT